jgi:hypothetical protein
LAPPTTSPVTQAWHAGYRTGKPAPAAALQPAVAVRLLHLSDDQHPTQPSLKAPLVNEPRAIARFQVVLALAQQRVNVLWAMPSATTVPTKNNRPDTFSQITNRIENRVLTTPQPRLLVWSSFGLVGRAVWAADARPAADTSGTLERPPGDRLTNQRRPSLPLVPMAGLKYGSQ